MKAIFSPGPSYFDENTRNFAGWVAVLELYRAVLEEIFDDVFVPDVPPELIDSSSTVAKEASYDYVAANQLPLDADLFLGPPGYSLAQIMKVKREQWIGPGWDEKLVTKPKIFTYVWNQADWFREKQLKDEYAKFDRLWNTTQIWQWINKKALQLSDMVIANSDFTASTHAVLVGDDKLRIVPWGVDCKKFHPMKQEPPGFRVLFPGSDPVRKGLFYLMRALDNITDYELWIVGCVPFAESPPNWKQFGMVPNEQVSEIYRQCHVMVLPTLEDGRPLAVQEAMASGLVPITTPVASEVFKDGVSGLQLDYQDIEGIKYWLEWLQYNPTSRRRMAEEARKKAESQTWQATKGKLKEVINECIS